MAIKIGNLLFLNNRKNLWNKTNMLSAEGIALTIDKPNFDLGSRDAILILTWKIETSAPKFVEPITKDCKPPKQQKVLR